MWPNQVKKYLAISIVFFFIFNGISITKCSAVDGECSSDFPVTGFFYVAEKDGVWWFVNSTGKKFYTVGVKGLGPGTFYYGDISDYVNITKKRLDEWGINTRDFELFTGMPYTIRIGTKNIVSMHGWTHDRIPDVFDPDWQNAVRIRYNEETKNFRDDPYLIGYATDNEMKWAPDEIGLGIGDNLTLLEVYMVASAETYGKQELVCFLSERYGNDTREFNHVWNMNITDFNDLFNHTKFGIEGWRVQSHLRSAKIKLYRDNPRFLKEPQLLEKAEEDVTDFSRLVAKTYFNFTNNILKSADPNHLNLGVQFHLVGVPLEVLEECGKYVDVISINYYYGNIFEYGPSTQLGLDSIKYGCVPLVHWMRKYHEITNKPILVSEFNFRGNDGSSLGASRYIIITQKQRADLFEWYAMNCFKNPYIIGNIWHIYSDGIVNLWGEPYKPLVDRMAKINNMAVEIHERSSKSTSIGESLKINFIPNIAPVSINFYNRWDKFETNDYMTPVIKSTYNSPDTKNITYYVDDVPGDGPSNPPENYTWIQDAIDNSSDRDTIFVYNGTYHEKIVINKSVSLVGEERTGTILIGFSEEDIERNRVITIEADYVNITGFNITTEKFSIDSFGNLRTNLGILGIYLKKHNNSNISGNIFYKLRDYGIISLKSDYTRIINNIFYDTCASGCGIIMDSSNNTLIDNNTFEDNDLYGIWMSCCKNNKIQNNFLSKSIFGIMLWKAHDNIVFGNTLWKNKEKGICLKECHHNAITSNNFINNPTPAAFFYSTCNVWNGNYWDRPRFLPRFIFGKTGNEALIPVVNIDHHPLREPHAP